jgi:hypothetical protein
MNDTNYFSIFITFRSELIYCADIDLRHSDLFPRQTELKVIGHHHTYMSNPNSKSSDILSDGAVKDILRPGSRLFFNQ